MVSLLVWSPVEVNSRIVTFEFPRLGVRDGQQYLSKLARLTIRNALGIHSHNVLTRQQPKIRTVLGQKEMVVAGNAVRAHVDATSPRKSVVAVDPNREVLLGFRALQIDVDALHSLAPPRRAVQESAQVHLEVRLLTAATTAIGSEEHDGGLSHS
jgi:hypothetical protein